VGADADAAAISGVEDPSKIGRSLATCRGDDGMKKCASELELEAFIDAAAAAEHKPGHDIAAQAAFAAGVFSPGDLSGFSFADSVSTQQMTLMLCLDYKRTGDQEEC
jgi:hypothetical protein